MREFRCNRHHKDGTPIIKDVEIADYAEELVGDYNPVYLEEPWNLDALRFAEYYLGATVDFVDIYCEEGEQIAGAAVFNTERIKLFDRENMCTRVETFEENTILIDNSTMQTGKETFARFTVLHEAGHICMHPSVYRLPEGQISMFDLMPSEGRSVVCCRNTSIDRRQKKLVTQEDFREHQANTFAAAVAMPRRIFSEIAKEAIRKMGCEEDYYKLPTLWETDYDPCADSLAEYMGKVFRVSKSAARVQLRKLKLIKTDFEAFTERQQLKIQQGLHRKKQEDVRSYPEVRFPVTIEEELPFA